MSRNIRSLSFRKELDGNLFDRLNEAARQSGAPSDEDLRDLAEESLLSSAITYGSSSFYDYLGVQNKGRKTWPCKGTACLISKKTAVGYADSGEALCVGYCYSGGGILKKNETGSYSSHHNDGSSDTQPPIPVYSFATTSILTGAAGSIRELYDITLYKSSQIIDHLHDSKLRGRGGAGFPFALKLKACAEQEADKKYIVCNADEGDPGAFSDRYLLEQQPHKVMAGMFAAANATGAKTCILYIRREYPEAISACREAIETFNKLSWPISNRVEFHIVEGAGSYVCGEETALLNSIEGLRPEVRVKPPYPAVYGLWGKPTVVSNVETFANISWILEKGGNSYASIGTDESKGTKLISLDARFKRPGLYEVDFGTPFEALVYDMAGGFVEDIKALQVGGPLGGIIPLNKIPDLIIDFNNFQQAGFALGHAGIVAVPKDFPIIDFMRHLFSYMAHESCGKCTPCRVGTAKGAEILAMATPEQPADYTLMSELLELLEEGSLCALGGGLPLPIRNCFEYFSEELKSYFRLWEG